MSRSGYSEDCDGWALIRWRGAVTSAIRGKRGQEFLTELAATMDAMPEKKIIEESLVTPEGDCCTMGTVFKARGVDVSNIDPDDPESVAKAIGLSSAMVQEIAYQNDECGRWPKETEEQRWVRMRAWVSRHIVTNPEAEKAKGGVNGR